MDREPMKAELERLYQTKDLYIYGAGDVAREVGYCLSQAPFEKTIKAFIVTDVKKEPVKSVLDKPIIGIGEVDDIENDALIIVAVLEKYRDEILNSLQSLGRTNCLCLTYESDLWTEVRKTWFLYHMDEQDMPVKELKDALKSLEVNDVTKHNLTIYSAKSPFDRILNNCPESKAWEKDIQVGAALVEERVSAITDFDGDNISLKNKQYNEMTALYWLWKHAKDDYIGLCHYRRKFDLTEADVNKICDSVIDVIITAPIINIPDVKYMFGKNHVDSDWDVFGDAVKAISPEYIEDYHRLGDGILYVPYNMVIMKRKVLCAYCEWAFRVFQYVEDHTPKREEDTYQRRNIGFLSERVMTVWLLHHWKELNIAIADKSFYE